MVGELISIAPSGLEPETTDPESVVLPITPQGKIQGALKLFLDVLFYQ